jgi:hypothetical protein
MVAKLLRTGVSYAIVFYHYKQTVIFLKSSMKPAIEYTLYIGYIDCIWEENQSIPIKKEKKEKNSGMVLHAYDPSTQEAEAGGLGAQGQPTLHIKTQS